MALVVGLTGGIASGKSTVSAMLHTLGLPVIDADVIAREVVEIGEPSYNQIVSVFGKEILNEDLTLNRIMLGSIIFNDSVKRQQLNAIVHPAVRKKMLDEKDAYFNKGEATVFLDIPLLFESNLTNLVDKTIVVYVDEEVQVKRLMNRNDFSIEEANSRISSQMPLREKMALADAVINNNGTVEETEKQLIEILNLWNIKMTGE
ncbi:dephospho-CoA kinase [Litchfieldia alkalitelluris]|uniref:dephospho-CoA kinase n=1 Tax=Litchfieldia alkalitelluris TaxID=304268 RepID=UPI00099722B0|nr:dephospho-CoA kinase [Litchfieldia alkalitelluris]